MKLELSNLLTNEIIEQLGPYTQTTLASIVEIVNNGLNHNCRDYRYQDENVDRIVDAHNHYDYNSTLEKLSVCDMINPKQSNNIKDESDSSSDDESYHKSENKMWICEDSHIERIKCMIRLLITNITSRETSDLPELELSLTDNITDNMSMNVAELTLSKKLIKLLAI